MNKNQKFVVRKVEMGKVVLPHKTKEAPITNADLFRSSEYGLYRLREKKNDYVNSNIRYNDKHPETLTIEQIAYLTEIFESVEKFIYSNPLLNPARHRITKTFRDQMAALKNLFDSYSALLDTVDLPNDLKCACKDLISFIHKFTESFNFYDSLIMDIRKIPNRPADCNLRTLVDEIILEFQKKNGVTKYPTFPYVKCALGLHRTDGGLIQLSPRQYGNFKLWRDRGTYWWYVQPQSQH